MIHCSIRKSINKTPREFQKNAGHIFPCRSCSLRIFSTSVRPYLNELFQAHPWVLRAFHHRNVFWVSSESYQVSRFCWLEI